VPISWDGKPAQVATDLLNGPKRSLRKSLNIKDLAYDIEHLCYIKLYYAQRIQRQTGPHSASRLMSFVYTLLRISIKENLLIHKIEDVNISFTLYSYDF